MKTAMHWSLACLLALAAPGMAQQQQPQQREPASRTEAQRQEKQQPADTERAKSAGENIKAENVFRTSKLNGMNVKNPNGEELGEIKDLVIDVDSGKVVYAALSVGGVLGIGDKLFAVPWNAFTLKHGEKDRHFVLAIDKEKFKTAKGFNQDNWPDVANKEWMTETEAFYETATKDAQQRRTRR